MRLMQKYVETLRQFVFYGIIGVITLGIDIVVTSILYNSVHLSAFFASSLGFISGFAFNFPMNRVRVFKHSDKDRYSLRTQITTVALLGIFNLLATSAIVHLLVTSNLLQIEYAKILVTALIAVWNFLLFKFLIFSKRL